MGTPPFIPNGDPNFWNAWGQNAPGSLQWWFNEGRRVPFGEFGEFLGGGEAGNGGDLFSGLSGQMTGTSGGFNAISSLPDLGFLFGGENGGTLANTLMALQLLGGLTGGQQGGELLSGISIGER